MRDPPRRREQRARRAQRLGVTVVGKPVTLNVLANDTDPDNDPLIVAAAPTLVIARRASTSARSTCRSAPDGELFFDPQAAGTYVFSYAIIDGEESDVGDDPHRRRRGRPTTARRSPIRDDVVIVAGGSRIVYVLENDADPDGDVIALIGLRPAPHGLTVKEVAGRRLPRHRRRPTRRRSSTFRYSDLRRPLRSGDGTVVVVGQRRRRRSTRRPSPAPTSSRCAPAARSACRCCVNDYDPEGGADQRSPSVTTVRRRPTLRIGLSGADGRRQRRRRRRSPASRFGYTSPTTAGNQQRVVRRGAHRARRTRSTARRSPAPTSPAPAAACRSRSTCSPTTPTPTATSSPSRASPPSRRSAWPRSNADGASSTRRATRFTAAPTASRYVVVDAGGDRRSARCSSACMPRRRRQPRPDGVRRRVHRRRRQRPARARRAGQRLRRRRRHARTSPAAAGERADRRVDDGAHARRVHPAGRRSPATPQPSHLRRTRSTTAAAAPTTATVTVDVVAAARRRSPRSPSTTWSARCSPGTVDDVDVLGQRPRPRRQPRRARRRRRPTRRSPFAADGSASRSRPAPTTSRHAYTITDPRRADRHAPSSTCSSCPTGPRPSPPIQRQTDAGEPVTDRPRRPGHRPRRRHPLLLLLRRHPQGGSATTVTNGAGAADRRRSPPTAASPAPAGVLLHASTTSRATSSPAPSPIDVLAPANRPPVATDATGTVEAGTTGERRPAPVRHRPRRGHRRHADVRDRATRRRASTPATAAPPSRRRRRSTPAAARGRSVHASPTRAGAPADGDGDRHGHAAQRAAADRRGRRGATNQGQRRDRRRARQRHRPARPRPARGRRPAQSTARRRSRSTPTAAGDVHAGADFFGTAHVIYRIRDAREHRAGQASRGQVDGRRRSACRRHAGHAAGARRATPPPPSTGRRPRPTARRSTTTSCDRRRRQPRRSASPQPTRAPGCPTACPCRSACGPTTRPAGVRGAASSPAVTPDIEPGRPAAPTRAVRRRRLLVSWSPPANEGSAITELRLADRRRHVGVQRIGVDHRRSAGTGLSNGRSTRSRSRRERRRARASSACVGAEHPLREPDAPGAPTGRPGRQDITVSWGAPGNGGDPIIEYQVQIGQSARRAGADDGHVDALGQPAQRPAPAVPACGPATARRLGRVEPAVGGRRAVRRARRAAARRPRRAATARRR